MKLNPAEISDQIKSRIEGLSASANIRNQGTVVSVTDGICRIHGLSDVMQGEMLEFPAGGQAFNATLDLVRNFCWIEFHDSFLLSLIGQNIQKLAL